MDILVVDRIKKSFRDGLALTRREVVHGVSLYARRGEILGFLGPNGAGKTTTIKVILGLMRPDAGSVTIFGRRAGDRSARSRIGYLPENPYFYPHLTLKEFLTFCGTMSGMGGGLLPGRVAEVTELIGLAGYGERRLKNFSKGMLQRAGLAQAILHDPDLLVLDEPFSGLDPLGRIMVRDVLVELRNRKKTVFFSSHILPDMEALCDRACIIRDGAIVRSVGFDELFRLGEGKVEVTVRGGRECIGDLSDYVEQVKSVGEETFLVVKRQEYVRTVITLLYRSSAEVLKVVNKHPSLEEVFLREIAPDRTGDRRAAETVEPVEPVVSA